MLYRIVYELDASFVVIHMYVFLAEWDALLFVVVCVFSKRFSGGTRYVFFTIYFEARAPVQFFGG